MQSRPKTLPIKYSSGFHLIGPGPQKRHEFLHLLEAPVQMKNSNRVRLGTLELGFVG